MCKYSTGIRNQIYNSKLLAFFLSVYTSVIAKTVRFRSSIPVNFINLCFRFASQLNSVLSQFEVNLNNFNDVITRLDKLELSLNNLKPEAESFYVFDQDTERTQKEFDVSHIK